jgi:pimeloyl-ACP methyl ester carboxylesterase
MNASFYEKQINSSLFQDFNITAFDLPGHGNSGIIESYTIPNLIEVIQNNLSDLNNIILIGHSLGGHLAIQLLPFLKSRCEGLILIGCPPLKLPLNVEDAYILNEVSANFLQKEVNDINICKMAQLIYPKDDAVFDSIVSSFKKTDGKFREDFATSLVQGEIQDEVKILKSFKGIIAFIAGSDDAILNLEYVAKLNDEINSSELHIVKNCGHCPQIESPLKLNQIIANFINDIK